MEAEEIKILRDMQAFIEHGIREDKSFDMIMANLYHDANGLVREKECFLPRSNDYSLQPEFSHAT